MILPSHLSQVIRTGSTRSKTASRSFFKALVTLVQERCFEQKQQQSNGISLAFSQFFFPANLDRFFAANSFFQVYRIRFMNVPLLRAHFISIADQGVACYGINV
jgi:hypothetical protein